MSKSRVSVFPLTLGLLVVVGLTMGSAAASTKYSVEDLGITGYQFGGIWDINEAGQVVGTWHEIVGGHHDVLHGFVWENGTRTYLDTLGGGHSDPRGINDLGQIVGTSTNAAGWWRACIWEAGSAYDLSPAGNQGYSGNGINNSGDAVGYAIAYYDDPRQWQDGTMIDLGTLERPYGVANAINDEGVIVGSSFTTATSGISHACVWNDTGLLDLGTFGGSYSYAYGVNESGQVVGRAMNSSGINRPFLWEGAGLVDLGVLGGSDGEAYDINERGQIVGYADVMYGYPRACLWEDGLKINLNNVLINGDGWMLTTARGINEAGQIVGMGSLNGATHGFLLTPTPAPAAILLGIVGIGLVAATRRIRRK